MDSISRPGRATEPRSGGKAVRTRRVAGRKTPYDRPPVAFSPIPSSENPNWLSRLIHSPTRMIASGAGKLLSSVFTTDSSSSSSSSDTGSDDVDDDNDDNDVSSQETDMMKKNGKAETITHIRSEYQPMVGRSENKQTIEQLLMQETFSREECDRLIRIIKSRVVDSPMIQVSGRIVDSDANMPELCSAAVMEAKNWLEKKKLGSNSKSELDLGPCTLNTVMLPDFTEGEAGSPVDMAKSYMQTRPPWASPSTSHVGYRSPSPTGTQLFKEDTPYSLGCTSSASKMKRDSPASVTWTISEELRKVRSKATEEMLRSLPSSKIDWSSFALEHKIVANSSVPDDIEARMRDKMQTSTKSLDASLNMATGVTTSYRFPVSQATREEVQNEALTLNPATLDTEQNQNVDDTQTTEETREERLSFEQGLQSLEDIKTASQSDAVAVNIDGLRDRNGASQPLNSITEGTIQDSGLHNQNCPTSKEAVGRGDSFAANGFSSSRHSLSAGHGPPDAEEDPVGLDNKEINPIAAVEEACDLLSEASMEVPMMSENDILPTGSQNSSSMCIEGISQGIQASSKRGVVGKTNGTLEKHKGRKLTRYNRRGRGRERG
ncbi:hypothetical protein ACOSQ2_008244 [Xanthoceras sorbifolium]